MSVPANIQPDIAKTPFVSSLLLQGAALLPPAGAPHVFQTTRPSPLLDEVIKDLVQSEVLVQCDNIVNAFRVFLVPKPNLSARPILDLSPWTDFYKKKPAIMLYSAVQVLVAIPKGAQLIKLDLKSGFFQIFIQKERQPFYGVLYRGLRYAWTRLPMGHTLAPSIMQRLATDVARHLHQQFQVCMVAYLDDWLLFSEDVIPADDILQELQHMGIVLNMQKSIITPTTRLTYLGLDIDTQQQTIRATPACLQHLNDLISLVPRATRQDLLRIAGYVSWLAWAPGWPQFLSYGIRHSDTYWLRVLNNTRTLHAARPLQPPLLSRVLHVDATPSSVSAVFLGPPQVSMVRHYDDVRPIAFAEMAAAIIGLLWTFTLLQQPTNITLLTDSMVVYHTLSKGTGLTLRASRTLQKLYIKMCLIKIWTGHSLVVRWVPSGSNLADPLSREYSPP